MHESRANSALIMIGVPIYSNSDVSFVLKTGRASSEMTKVVGAILKYAHSEQRNETVVKDMGSD
jgi:hypothetical protein